MKKLFLALSLLLFIGNIMAQESRVEKTRNISASEDSKENSAEVPDVYGVETEFKQIIIARCKYKSDLLASIDTIVKQYNIKHAVILSGIGAVRGYHYHTVSSRTFPSSNMYVKNPTAPADVASLNGYIINGRVHAHITFADPDHCFGGHLEYGTEVYAFGIITIGILNDDADIDLVDYKHYR